LRFFDDGKRRPCQCGCGRIGEAIHHLLARVPGKGGRRDHWFVVLLSHSCHNLGRDSIHMLGSEAKFKEVHGVDLPAIAVANLNAWEAEFKSMRGNVKRNALYWSCLSVACRCRAGKRSRITSRSASPR
jgi:hypothetical protein